MSSPSSRIYLSLLATALLVAGCARPVSISLSPSETEVSAGGAVAFTATVTGTSNTEVSWSVDEGEAGGAVSGSGLYSAPASPGTFHITATSSADPTKAAKATVVVTASSRITVELFPDAATVGLGGLQMFVAEVGGAANTGVSWSIQEGAAGGSISLGGTYFAPQTPGVYHVVATSRADPSKRGMATVSVVDEPIVSVAIAPESVTVGTGLSQQFTARVAGNPNTAVTWSIEEPAGGSIKPSGVYTAPSGEGTFHVLATSEADPTKKARAMVRVISPGVPVSVSISPASVVLAPNGSQDFTAVVTGSSNTQVNWRVQEGAAGGVVDERGRYTAPASAGAYHLIATSAADVTKSATAAITVQPTVGVGITITPANASILAGDSRAFVATVTGTVNTGASWAVQEGSAGGSVTNQGIYTAPMSQGTYHVVATSLADPNQKATATVTVLPIPVSVQVTPFIANLVPGGTAAFTATVLGTSNAAVIWSVQQGSAGGTISNQGIYTAPATPGSYVIQATSAVDPTAIGLAQVEVIPAAGYAVNGAVSYGGSATGRIFIVAKSSNGTVVGGTSLASPGTFTLRGIQANGPISISAYRDALNLYSFNKGADPRGEGSLTLPGSGTVVLALSDPAPVAPSPPRLSSVMPSAQSALVMFDLLNDVLGEEIADRYNLYWSTSSNPGPTNKVGSVQLAPNTGFAVVSDGPSTPLVNGTAYYFALTAMNHGAESAPSAVVGPVTIGPSSGSSAVTGTISFGSVPVGPLYLVAFEYTGAGYAAHIVKIPNPVSPQSYTIGGLAPGYHLVYAWIDAGNDGTIGPTDVNNFKSTQWVQVGGGTLTQNFTFNSGESIPQVTTEHSKYFGTERYQLGFDCLANSKQPVSVVVTSGPNVAGPMDLAMNGFGMHAGNRLLDSTVPALGQTYVFDVTYSDGTSASINAAISGVIAGFANPTSPIGVGGRVPTFSWSSPNPSPPGGYSFNLFVYEDSGAATWPLWYVQGLPAGQTTTQYNSDGRARTPQLTAGLAYRWYLTVEDSNGNRSVTDASFRAQ